MCFHVNLSITYPLDLGNILSVVYPLQISNFNADGNIIIIRDFNLLI